MTDIAALQAKLTEEKAKILEADENVRKLIISAKDRYKTLTIGDQEIRIRPTIPRDVRKEIERITKQETSVEESESLMYALIARMCLDDPFDKAETWEYIDNETGQAMEFLGQVYKEAVNTDSQIKSFRRV